MIYEHDLVPSQINVLKQLYKNYPKKDSINIRWTASELACDANFDNNTPQHLRNLNQLYRLRLVTGTAYNLTHANCKLTKFGKKYVEKYFKPTIKTICHVHFFKKNKAFKIIKFHVPEAVNIADIDDFLRINNLHTYDYFDTLPRKWTLSNLMIHLLKTLNDNKVHHFSDNFDALHCLDNLGIIKGTQHNEDYITCRITALGSEFVTLMILPELSKHHKYACGQEISDYLISAHHFDKKINSIKIKYHKKINHFYKLAHQNDETNQKMVHKLQQKIKHDTGEDKERDKRQLFMMINVCIPSSDDMLLDDVSSQCNFEISTIDCQKDNIEDYAHDLCIFGHPHVNEPYID